MLAGDQTREEMERRIDRRDKRGVQHQKTYALFDLPAVEPGLDLVHGGRLLQGRILYQPPARLTEPLWQAGRASLHLRGNLTVVQAEQPQPDDSKGQKAHPHGLAGVWKRLAAPVVAAFVILAKAKGLLVLLLH